MVSTVLGPQSTSDLEQVHALFRGSTEVAKRLRLAATVGEFGAVLIALPFVFGKIPDVDLWVPLVAFLLIAGSALLRVWSQRATAFGEKCRRKSVRAFASGVAINPGLCSSLRADAPMGAQTIAAGLPATNLDEYYVPTRPVGPLRLRELYAHSAFYTWRLLRATAAVCAIVSLLVVVLTLVALYGLVAADLAAATRQNVLEALFTVVLGAVALRLIVSAIECRAATTEMRRLADALVTPQALDHSALQELVDEYDFECAAAPAPFTWLYRWMRDDLAYEWSSRREALP